MAKLQSVVGPISESVRTVAFVQHQPDMVLVHEAKDTALKDCEALDVMEEGWDLVCDGCESVLVGSSSRSSRSSGPFGDGMYGGGCS